MTIRQNLALGRAITFISIVPLFPLCQRLEKALVASSWNKVLAFLIAALPLCISSLLSFIFFKYVPAACPDCGGRAYLGDGGERKAPYVCRDRGHFISWERQASLQEAELANLRFLGKWPQRGPLAGMIIGVIVCGALGLLLASYLRLTDDVSLQVGAYLVLTLMGLGLIAGALVGLRDLERATSRQEEKR